MREDTWDPNKEMASLKPKNKEPHSLRVLNSWIDHAEQELGAERSGRLAWLVATTVAAAKLQQVLDGMGQPAFVLKGGTMLQHRLGMQARASQDMDGIVTEDLDRYLTELDERMEEPWGPISFRRTVAETIRVPSKAVKPRRFELILELKGKVWRRVKVEISPDEGKAGSSREFYQAPSLVGFGLPTPDSLAGIAMSYQIAQKYHAATSPHNPPAYVNNRPRDVVDLLLMKRLVENTGFPQDGEIASAIWDVFAVRAEESQSLGRRAHVLPTYIRGLSHWAVDYQDAARSCGLAASMQEAVNEVNDWIGEILGADAGASGNSTC